MRWKVLVILLLGLAGLAQAADPAAKEHVQAAAANAVSCLYDQVCAAHLGDDLTVGQYVEQVGGAAQLRQTLEQADQIGEPRWIGPGTCQVQMEISGRKVAAVLGQVAGAHPERSPLSPEGVQRAADGWIRQSFTATGTSLSADALAHTQLMLDDHWSAIPQDVREKALVSARGDAVRRVVDSIRPVGVSSDHTLGEALGSGDAKPYRAVVDWMMARPITRVDFRSDMQVELELAVDGDEFVGQLRSAVALQKVIALPADDKAWATLRSAVLARLAKPVGHALVASGARAPVGSAVRLPQTPPDWVDAQWQIEGKGEAGRSKLRAARRAEADAVVQITARMNELPLGKDLTVGQAGKADPAVAAAVARAAAHAEIFRTEYHADGTSSVWMQISLHDLWDELHGGE
jgi:hypothetical protein